MIRRNDQVWGYGETRPLSDFQDTQDLSLVSNGDARSSLVILIFQTTPG